MFAKKGVLAVVSGFSGAGKGTTLKALLAKYPQYGLSISATTRNPREGEEHGREYFFLSKEEFEDLIAKDGFIEYAQYVNNYYGTPRSYVESKLAEGKDVILEIEAQGALNVKKQYPDALLIFMTPPSGQELYNRLKGRGTEKDEVILDRLKRAVEEADIAPSYDYLVINDTVDHCVLQIHELIQKAHYQAYSNQPFLNQVKSEINSVVSGLNQ